MPSMQRRNKRSIQEVNPLCVQSRDIVDSEHSQKEQIQREEEGKVRRTGKREEKGRWRKRDAYNRRMHIVMLCVLFVYLCLSGCTVFCVIRLLLTGKGFFQNLETVIQQTAGTFFVSSLLIFLFFFFAFMYKNAGGSPEHLTRRISNDLEASYTYRYQEAAEYRGYPKRRLNPFIWMMLPLFMIFQLTSRNRFSFIWAPLPIIFIPIAVVFFHQIYYKGKKQLQYYLMTRISKVVLHWENICSGLNLIMAVHWAVVYFYFFMMLTFCFFSSVPLVFFYIMLIHMFWTGLMVQLSGTIIGYIWSNEFIASEQSHIKRKTGQEWKQEGEMMSVEYVRSVLHQFAQVYLYLFMHLHRLCSVSLFFFPMVISGTLKDFLFWYKKRKNVIWIGPGPNGEPEGRPVPRQRKRNTISPFDRAEAACLYCILEGDIYQVWKKKHRARYGSRYWVICKVLPGWDTLFGSVARLSVVLPFIFMLGVYIMHLSKNRYTVTNSGTAETSGWQLGGENSSRNGNSRWYEEVCSVMFFFLCTWFFSFTATSSMVSILFGSFKALFMLRDNYIEDRKKTADYLFNYVMEEIHETLKHPMMEITLNIWGNEIDDYSVFLNDRDFLDRLANI